MIWTIVQFVLGAIGFVLFWFTILVWIRTGCRFPRVIHWLALSSIPAGPLLIWIVSLSGPVDIGWALVLLVLAPLTVYGGAILFGALEFESVQSLSTSIEVGRDAHITLRRLIDSDLDFLAEMLSDPDVMRYWPAPLDRAGAEQWLRKQQQRYINDDCGYWLILDDDTKQPVGQAGVLMTDIEGERLPCLGYIMHKPFWRQGYAIRAASACLDFIWGRLNAPTAYTLIRPENEPSMALARKLGMQPLRTVQFSGFEHVLLKLDRQS